MATTMLTAQQVQDLLDVDTSTIYRMAGDGRLPAVRVGRQWRFPADAIDRLLVPDGGSGDAPSANTAAAAPAVVPRGVATALLETVAPLLGVSMVVTDLAGRPLTPIVHPAPFIARHLDDPDFAAVCVADWAGFAAEAHLAPRLRPGRYGFLCAHGFVRDGARLIAMVLAGGIAPGEPGSDSASPDLFELDEGARRRVLETIPRLAALLSLTAARDGLRSDA
jgi:excisionase family DNA binding protein